MVLFSLAKFVLVFGGTGNYGKFIVESLVAKNIPVKVFTRDTARAKQKLGEKPEYFEGDVLDQGSILNSLENVRAIIISLSAMHPKLIRKQKEIEHDAVMSILDGAEKKGIKRIIFISIYDIRTELIEKLKLNVGLLKMAIEERLAKSDFFNWTVLGCPPSYMIFTRFTRKRMMIVPGGGSPLMPSIAPQDVGEIAAQASIRDDLNKKRFRMTFSKPFAFPEVAKLFSDILGRRIRYQKIPLFGLKIASIISYPFNPYLRHLVKYVGLLNNFPKDFAKQAAKDHQLLLDNFDFQPMTLEEYVKIEFHITS
ncbi:MAG: NAD-dependent epimerase/dehydratase family protein [Asgard group archaeon]|nr:NAD-dependent epimerase/dehydratase family protein [Asgard group archaeon]